MDAEPASSTGTAAAPEPVVIEARDPAMRWPTQSRGWIVATLLAVGVTGFGVHGIGRGPTAPASVALDAAAQAQLLEARDGIASRSEPRLSAAITVLQKLRRQFYGSVSVHESLAEGYLLAREFGSLSDALAFEKARTEAKIALSLNPRSQMAARVMGVIGYWWDRDLPAAGRSFQHAVAVAPDDALTRQWYANVLSDNGEDAAALREFAVARNRNPGAPYLTADYAWALWAAGRDQEAQTILESLAVRYPSLASVHDCLSVIAFARGDFSGYARHLQVRASSRATPELVSYAELVNRAVGQHPRALYSVMLTRALMQAEMTATSDHSWAAFVASKFGNRAKLVTILGRARDQGERWGSSGFVRRIASRWASDQTITDALTQLEQGRIVKQS